VVFGDTKATTALLDWLPTAATFSKPETTASASKNSSANAAKPKDKSRNLTNVSSYQTNRQLSGWNLPPLVIRAIGAH